MQIIRIPPLGVTIRLEDNGGGIMDAYGPEWDRQDPNDLVNDHLDVLQAVILAHACSGLDVTESRYVEGIRTVLDKVINNAE